MQLKLAEQPVDRVISMCKTLLMFNTIALSCLCVNLSSCPLQERVPTALLLAAAISNLQLPLCNVTDNP